MEIKPAEASGARDRESNRSEADGTGGSTESFGSGGEAAASDPVSGATYWLFIQLTLHLLHGFAISSSEKRGKLTALYSSENNDQIEFDQICQPDPVPHDTGSHPPDISTATDKPASVIKKLILSAFIIVNYYYLFLINFEWEAGSWAWSG